MMMMKEYEHKPHEASAHQKTVTNEQHSSVAQNKFLSLFNVLKESIKETRTLENKALVKFGVDLEKMLSDSSSVVSTEKHQLKTSLSLLQREKNNLVLENKRLVVKINSLIDSGKKSKQESEKFKQFSVKTQAKLSHCNQDVELLRNKETDVISNFVNIKKSIQTLKGSSILKLIQSYSSYKKLFKSKEEDNARMKLKILHYESLLKRQITKFHSFQQVLVSTMHKEESCWVLKNKFSEALTSAKSYKSLLVSRQDELGWCQNQARNNKKILTSTSNFYLYLLKRLAQVGDGINHMKIVEHNIRLIQ